MFIYHSADPSIFNFKCVVPSIVLVISPWPKASKNVVSKLDHLFVILYYLIMVFVGYFNILFCFCFFFLSFTFAAAPVY